MDSENRVSYAGQEEYAVTDSMVGKVFGERYKIIERVGLGGMAEVYRATDIVLGRTVAVKIMLPQYAADEEFADRFRQEAASAANLSSPFVVNIYDWGMDGGTYYIVMEYVRGSDLKSGIKQRGALSAEKTAEIGEQVCSALAAAHKQDIIHRDIKPQNIMVQPDGNVKVMDFGIAQSKNSLKTATGSILGTAHYISPEQAQGKELSGASDLYSLGVVLYECATGQVPFDGPDAVSVAVKQVKDDPVEPHVVNPDVDGGLESIILRAMRKDPSERYCSAAEMREALLAFLDGTPIDGFGNPVAADAAATVVLGSDVAAGIAADHAAIPVGAHTYTGSHSRAARSASSAPDGFNDYDRHDGRGDVDYDFAGENPDMGTAIIPSPSATRVLAQGPERRNGTVVPVTSAQAQARARLAARDYAAANGSYQAPADTGSVRRVAARDTAYDGPRKGRLAVILAIVAAVAAVVIGGLVWFGHDVVDVPNTVPSVVGKSQTEAAKAIKAAGYSVGEITKEYSDTVDAGYVISQTPTSGTEFDVGGDVDLVVSLGIELVSVPSITGNTVTELQEALEAVGLIPKAGEAMYSNTVDTNRVISQDPIAGAKVEKGSTVTYVLSLGVDYVTVPDVTGRTSSEAQAILARAGFTTFEQAEYSSTVDKDKVIRQSPSGNAMLERGGAVTIVVSQGLELVTIPNVVGLTMKEATSKLLAAGLSVSKTGNTDDSAEVIEQTPPASPSTADKDKVEKGTLVTITGKVVVEVTDPQVIGEE